VTSVVLAKEKVRLARLVVRARLANRVTNPRQASIRHPVPLTRLCAASQFMWTTYGSPTNHWMIRWESRMSGFPITIQMNPCEKSGFWSANRWKSEYACLIGPP
jgi:hypothetical protein